MSAKLSLIAGLAALALTLTSSGASAEWDVNGAPLAGSAALLSKEPALAHGIISVQTVGVTVECKGSEVLVSGGEIIAPNEVLLKSLDFGQCAASGGGCSLKKDTILTLPLRGLANLAFLGSLTTNITLLAVSTKIAVLEFEGLSCALTGSQSITEVLHDLDILLDGGADSAVRHLALFLSLEDLKIPPVKLGELSAPLSGFNFDLQLTNGQTWNFL